MCIFAAVEKIVKGKAIVVKHTGSHYLISRLPEWDPFPVVIRGKLRLLGDNSTNPLTVGDIVEYEEGVISDILPRKNCVIRQATNLSKQTHIIAANIDVAYLVVTIDCPDTKWAFIDRFLVTCQAYKVPVKIILNKIDLYDRHHSSKVALFKKIYGEAGYDIIDTSAITNRGVDVLRKECNSNGISLFSGVSGVGKSSLIKALDPSLTPKILPISEAHLQGKHTTTFYEMYPLTGGGFIIDTPGIRGFGLVDLDKNEISTYFPEMLRVMDGCRYKPCTHTHEPYCAVKEAVDLGTISLERYNSYLGMLEDKTKYRI